MKILEYHHHDSFYVVTEVDAFSQVYQEVDAAATVQEAKLVWRPMAEVAVAEDNRDGLMRLLTSLDDNDDVQNVYTNADLSSLADAGEAG